MQRAFVILAASLAVTHAQFGWFSPDPPPRAEPGAGRSVSEVICTDPQLGTLCRAAGAASKNPVVAELEDPTFTGTIFAPVDEAFEESAGDLEKALGIQSVFVIPTEPAIAARVIGAHVIPGTTLQFGQLQNGQTYRAADGGELKITTGYLWGKYVNGARLRESEGANNIPAARAVIHKITGVIIPT